MLKVPLVFLRTDLEVLGWSGYAHMDRNSHSGLLPVAAGSGCTYVGGVTGSVSVWFESSSDLMDDAMQSRRWASRSTPLAAFMLSRYSSSMSIESGI